MVASIENCFQKEVNQKSNWPPHVFRNWRRTLFVYLGVSDRGKRLSCGRHLLAQMPFLYCTTRATNFYDTPKRLGVKRVSYNIT